MQASMAHIWPIEKIVEYFEFQSPRPKIVLANGIFDILHGGHISYIQSASKLGSILVVALNDDRSACGLKGSGRPVMRLQERMTIMAGLRWVDFVTWFEELRLDRVLRLIRPNFHAKGRDYTEQTIPERDVALEVGAKPVCVGKPKSNSSTKMIDKIFLIE